MRRVPFGAVRAEAYVRKGSAHSCACPPVQEGLCVPLLVYQGMLLHTLGIPTQDCECYRHVEADAWTARVRAQVCLCAQRCVPV